jgi:hypothetical protein
MEPAHIPAQRALALLAALVVCQLSCSSPHTAGGAAGPGAGQAERPGALVEDLDRQKEETRARLEGRAPATGSPAPSAPAGAADSKPAVQPPAPPQPRAASAAAPSAAPAALPSGPPRWYTQRGHPDYPDSAYLLGVGSAELPGKPAGEALQQAQAAAVADILAQFKSRVRLEVTNFIQQSLQVRGDKEEARLFQSGAIAVSSSVEGTLRGVSVADRYHDPERGFACVLAVLERKAYARQLAEELAAIEERVRGRLDEGRRREEEGDFFRAYRRHREAEDLLVAGADLKARMRYADPSQPLPESAAATPAEVHAARRRLASRVEVHLAVRHQAFGKPLPAAAVEERLVSRLQASGFRVKPPPAGLVNLPAEALASDFAGARKALGAGGGHALLLILSLTSEGRDVEGELLAVRTEGWARLIDAAAEEILVSAATEAGARRPAAIVGLPTKGDESARRSAIEAAESLAERVLLHF